MITWIRKQFLDSAPGKAPLLPPAEQTRLSWAKRIESYSAVPPAYKDFFEPMFTAGQTFPYVVLTPSFEGFIQPTTEKLVCDIGREVYVLEKSGNSFVPYCYPLDGVSFVEIRSVLLDAHIKITGVTKDDVPASSTIRFNTVTDYMFMTILKKIRLAGVDSGNTTEGSEVESFDHWARLNYKFMNYARRSLLGGEKVLQAILQPEIHKRWLTFLGHSFYRTIAPIFAAILTDRELIIVREEEHRPGHSEKYGGIWDYIPLNKVSTLSLKQKDKDLFAFSIQLPNEVGFEFLFQESAEPEIRQLIEQFEKAAHK